MRREARPGVTARRLGTLLTVVTMSGVCAAPLTTATVANAAPPTIASAVLVNDATNPAFSAVTSGDGRWTFYYQGGRLWAFDAAGATGNKVMVGRTTAGEELPLSNSFAASDQTGRFVAFTGYVDLYNPVSNLVGFTTYLHDRDTDGDGVFDEPGSISTIQLGTRLTNTVLEPSISSDGRYVGFLEPDVSAAVDVAQSNRCIRAYRYDRLTRAVIDLTLPDNEAPLACDPLVFSRDRVSRVRLSADGGSAALETGWEALAPTGLQTAFRFGVVRDAAAGITERLIFEGTINNNNVFLMGFSGDARYVLALGEANSALLRLDRGAPLSAANTTLTIPVGPSSFPIALSGDGRAVISGTTTGTQLWRSSGTVTLTTEIGPGAASSASLNLDGSVATITTSTPPAGVAGHGVTDAYRLEVQATASYTLSAGLSLGAATTPPAATAIPIGNIPADVVRSSNLDLAGAPIGGKGVAPIGGKGVAPIGGKGAAPLGGKGAAPLGGKGAAPLGGKGVAALDDLAAVRRLPLAMIPVAGGWATLLKNTPLAARPVQTVTLGQVIDRAPAALAALRPDQLDLRRTVLADATPAAWALGTTPVRQLIYSGGATFCEVLREAQDPVPGATADAFCDATGITPTMTMFQIDLDPHLAGVVATAPELHSPPIAPNLLALRAGDGAAQHSAPLLDLPLPALGLGVSRAGDVPLVDLVETTGPVASLTLKSLGDLAAVADCSLIDCTASGTVTLGQARTARALRTDATLRSISVELPAIKLDDVAAQLAPDVDLNDLLVGTLEADQFPWEELDLVASGVQQYVPNPNFVHATIPLGVCSGDAGDCPDVVSGTVTLTLPRSFRVRTGSASIDGGATVGAVSTTSTASSTVVTIAVGNVTPNVTASLGVDLLPGFTLGSYTVAAKAALAGRVSTPASVQVKVVEPIDVAGTAAGAATAASDTLYVSYVTSPDDVDLFRVPAASGKIVSVWVSHFERDADVVLYGPRTTSVSSRSNRAAGPTTGAVADDGADGGATAPAASSEAARDLPAQPGLTPVASSATAVDGGTESATALSADLVQVSAYSGVTSLQPYVLRIRTDATITPAACTYSPANPSFTTGTAAGSFSMPTGPVETLVLTAPERFGRKYGAAAVSDIDTKLAAMLLVPGTSGAVVDVASDSAVAAAFSGWNGAWCDYDAANRVVRALTDLITRVHDAHPELRSVVIVGGDDILPMARLDDTTRLANEDSYADDVPAGPLHEALRTRHFLSDDPYADLDPIPFVDRQIFVPDLSVGRLVEDPTEIGAAIDAYVSASGRLDPAGAYVTGYDFMADGANLAADRLEAAFARAGGPSNLASRLVTNTWTAQQAIAGLAGAAASGLYAHFGYNLGMSAAGFQRDQSISFDPSPDTFSPADVAGALRPTNTAPTPRLLFSMGCHAGLSVPGYTDFAQAIVGTGAMFVGVSTYGMGNTVGTALDERLMASFAGNLDGQLINGTPMTVGEALTQAKQDYWAGQGLYGPYDEKVLQSTVFYGLPMYRVAPAGATTPPVRSAPAPVVTSATASPYRSHSVAVASTFVTNNTSTGTQYVSVGAEEPLSVPNRPVQPRTITEVTASDGTNLLPAHGGLVTSLSASQSITGFAATFPRPTAVDSSVEPAAVPVDVAFPSSLVAITTASDLAGQPQADGGPRQRQYLVTVPGRFRSGDTPGVGTQDLFGGVDVDVLYSVSTDYAPPRVGTTRAIDSSGTVAFTVDTTDDSTTGVQRVLVLYRTPSGWVSLDLMPPVSPGGSWTGAGAGVTEGTFEYLVQSVDSAGNVGTGAGKGRGVAAYTPPVVGDVIASISDGQFVEGSGGGTTAGAVNVTLDRPAPAGGLSFGVALQSGTASVGSAAGDDVSSNVTNVVVPEGALSAPVSFAIAADGKVEGDQAFTVTVTAPSGVDLTRPIATVVIVDDDRPVVLAWENTAPSFVENGSWMVHADFASPIQSPVTVAFTVNPGTATADDLTVTSDTTVALQPGDTFVELSGVFVQDHLYEGTETFSVTMAVTSGPAVAAPDTTYITLLDSDSVPTVSFGGGRTTNEGDLVQLPLTLTSSSAAPLTIHWVGVATAPPIANLGSATAEDDYPVAGEYTIPAGTDCANTECTLPVQTVLATDLDAYQEVFDVRITSVDWGLVDPLHDTATVVIYDAAPAATLSLSVPDTVVESDGSVPITVTLSRALPVDAVVRIFVGIDTRDGANSADPVVDVVVPTDGLQATIPAGTLSATVNLSLVNDGIAESPETIALGVDSVSTSPQYLVDTPARGYVTITDAVIVVPTATIASSVSFDENAGTAMVEVTLDSTAGPGGASFTYSSSDGTALAGSDYTTTSGTLVFAAGQQSAFISVAVTDDDSTVEPSESFTLGLADATNAAIAVSQSTVTIIDSDRAGVTVGSAVVLEGTAASGRTEVLVTVTLDRRLLTDATYSWSITGGTGAVGADVDAAPLGTFTIPQGAGSFTLPIEVVPDDLDEVDESVSVTLTAVSGPLTTVVGTGTVTITDDDLAVMVTASDTKVLENAGSALITVTLDRPSLAPLSIPFTTSAGSATAPADFTATAGSLSFPIGATSASITVPIVNDNLVEGIAGENFGVVLTPATNTFIVRQATVSIVDDESPYLMVQSASQQIEGDRVSRSLTFSVTLSQPLNTAITLSWVPSGITATAGVDFPSAGGTVTIARRKTTATITVPISPDTVIEGNETLALSLSSTGAAIGSGAPVGTIVDDDDVALSISDASIVEPNKGTKNVTLTVRLSTAKVESVTVRWTTVDGTATVAGGDYIAASGTLTIAAGQTSATITIAVIGDRSVEPDETFRVVLSAPVRAVIGAVGTATATIINND